MTIRDPLAFGRLIRNGIGRHKAYGYGMLLLRPPDRTLRPRPAAPPRGRG